MNLKIWMAQGGKFILVGISNTLITLSFIYISTRLFHLHYLLANAAGYTLGLINSYIWNRLWTFRSRGNPLREGLLFLIMFGICYTIQVAGVIVLVRAGVGKDVSQLIGIFIYTSLNFLLSKLVTFKERSS